jgi:hypothetical protein
LDSLTEKTPEHSSFTVFRQRLPQEVFDAVHLEILKGLKAYGLLKGRHLGVDSSIIEANASLSGLASRNTEESYREYVRGLARRREWMRTMPPPWPVLTANEKVLQQALSSWSEFWGPLQW